MVNVWLVCSGCHAESEVAAKTLDDVEACLCECGFGFEVLAVSEVAFLAARRTSQGPELPAAA